MFHFLRGIVLIAAMMLNCGQSLGRKTLFLLTPACLGAGTLSTLVLEMTINYLAGQ
jgi:hypothetical protein